MMMRYMPDIEYIYPDVHCPRCKTKYGITLSNGIVGCSICGNEVAKAKKHVSVKMKESIKISDNVNVKVTRNN